MGIIANTVTDIDKVKERGVAKVVGNINRYLIIFSASIIIIFFLAIIFSKQFNYKKNELEKSDNSLSNADISEPKFAINNKSKKIFITAKEGNFITKNEILPDGRKILRNTIILGRYLITANKRRRNRPKNILSLSIEPF